LHLIYRLEKLFEATSPRNAGIEKLYRTLYAGLANYYRASEKVRIDGADVLQPRQCVRPMPIFRRHCADGFASR